MGIEIDSEYGGTNSTFFAANLVIEELAKVDPAISVMVDVQNTLINTLIKKLGTPAQKEKYLTRLATDMVRGEVAALESIISGVKFSISDFFFNFMVIILNLIHLIDRLAVFVCLKQIQDQMPSPCAQPQWNRKITSSSMEQKFGSQTLNMQGFS